MAGDGKDKVVVNDCVTHPQLGHPATFPKGTVLCHGSPTSFKPRYIIGMEGVTSIHDAWICTSASLKNRRPDLLPCFWICMEKWLGHKGCGDVNESSGADLSMISVDDIILL